MTDRDVLVVLGPTASGKSDVAMAVAADAELGVGAEIVAVDAMQVYRGMDIGTAKPTDADRSAVPHHCLDLVDPDHDFALAEFATVGLGAIADIEHRSGRPLLVGGTGLYLRALTDPMEMPGTWPHLRAQLEERAEAEGASALHAELITVDPDAAAKMEPSNVRRIVRALEVWQGSGRRFSSFGPGVDQYPPIRFRQVGLRWPRELLSGRIERRVHRMMELGLLAEVTDLAQRYPGWSRTARQALGYKELLAHLDGECSLDEAVEQIVLRTRQFAVRQERWFRRDPRVRWVDIHDDAVGEVLAVLRRDL